MAFNYSANDLATPLNHVRFLVQDTVDKGHFFEDGEIEFAITQESNLYRVAANLCRAAAAQLAKTASVEDATITFDSKKAADHYLSLAKTYDAKANAEEASMTDPESTGLSLPSIGNGSDSLPAFTRGLHFS